MGIDVEGTCAHDVRHRKRAVCGCQVLERGALADRLTCILGYARALELEACSLDPAKRKEFAGCIAEQARTLAVLLRLGPAHLVHRRTGDQWPGQEIVVSIEEGEMK